MQTDNRSWIYDSRRKIFLRILKPLADLTNLTEADFVDWGNAEIT
jgi:sulfite reductase (ferredoxin)